MDLTGEEQASVFRFVGDSSDEDDASSSVHGEGERGEEGAKVELALESLAFKRPADGGKEALDLLERYDMRSLVPRIEKLWEELDSQNEKS